MTLEQQADRMTALANNLLMTVKRLRELPGKQERKAGKDDDGNE
jgi:hypothetical protein